jgi:hypothetical protein
MHTLSKNQRRLSWAAVAITVAVATFELGAAFVAGWRWALAVLAIVAGFAVVGALEVSRRRRHGEHEAADALLGFLAGAVFLLFVVGEIAANRAAAVIELRGQHACPE